MLFWDLALVKANQCNYIKNGVQYAITIFINVSDNSALLTLRLKGRFNRVLASFINGQMTKFKIFNFHKFARRITYCHQFSILISLFVKFKSNLNTFTNIYAKFNYLMGQQLCNFEICISTQNFLTYEKKIVI